MTTQPSSLRVLIVDDEALMLAHVRNLLRQMTIHDVIEASNGKAALDILMDADQPFPDLIITDLHMDGMDGIEFCNTVRRTEMLQNVGVPIIMLTGEDDDFILNVTKQVGALFVAHKPIELEELRDLIERHASVTFEPM